MKKNTQVKLYVLPKNSFKSIEHLGKYKSQW